MSIDLEIQKAKELVSYYQSVVEKNTGTPVFARV